MSDKMYYWGEGREAVEPEETFIEFSAKPAQIVPSTPLPPGPDGGGGGGAVERRELVIPDIVYPDKPPEDGEEERGGWGNKLDFLFSCISVSVGLGNVWRFPYLCYKNGGGAFLVTYGIAMVLCGIPIFFQEVAVGQYLGSGGMTLVGQLCPILQGVGYATMTIVFFLDVYYCIIIAWTLFYLLASFVSLPGLPWESCGNWWNSESCFTAGMNVTAIHLKANHTTTPVEEYWDRRVLGITSGINDLGGIQWELLGCLVLGWGLVYVIVCKGLHQSGKDGSKVVPFMPATFFSLLLFALFRGPRISVVVTIIWFTALFPYFVLFVLLGRAVTLNGATQGLLYYVTPRWEELLGPGPWIDGATQIFFAYSIGTGALPALGSYNKFHHNCYKDALITCVVNTFTCLLAGCVTFSILGHIAVEQDCRVEDVVKSGPGLVFLTYPEVVLKLPGAPAWAAIFFFMLVILGIDSEFCIVESFVTGMVDNWPETLRPHRGKFTMFICTLMMLLGIPMVTHGGAYIFQLMDFYSASGMSLLWVCFFQTIAISWIFGAEKFIDCIHQMMGIRINRFWYICWVYLSPAVMAGIFVFYCVQYKPITYGKSYEYPGWAEGIGLLMSFSSMMWIPVYAIYYVLASPGTIKENFLKGLQPNIKQSRADLPPSKEPAVIPLSESSAGLLPKNSSFLSQ